MTSLRKSSCSFAVALALALAGGLIARTAVHAQGMPNPSTLVKPQTYVSLDKVPRGQTFEAAVVVDIEKGFHMNSNKPSEDYLIPTTLTPNPPQGIKVVDTTYPPGQMKNFSFSKDKPLNVYTDTVTLRLKLAADASAPLGATSIPLTLRYQACNDTTCLPPVKVPITVSVEVAAAGTATHKVHPDIFK
jgi:uncharacterized protein YcnI